MPQNEVTCEINIGGTSLSFNNVLRKVSHYKGFDRSSSYIVIMASSPSQGIFNSLSNFSSFRVRYGGDSKELTDWITFETWYIDNSIKFSDVTFTLIGVEPGFLRLTESVAIRSFPDQSVSDVVSTLAKDADLNTLNVRQTSGNYTFIQPNITDLQFLKCLLLPISTDSSKSAPYLFTVDQGNLYWKPPKLKGRPIQEFIVDSSIDTNVKEFMTGNMGILGDVQHGDEYVTYGYDPVKKGLLTKSNKKSSSTEKLNSTSYESEFLRQKVFSYDQQWMVDAHNKNEIARGSFAFSVMAKVIGHHSYDFDELYKFTIPTSDKSVSPYTGNYYAYSVIHTIVSRQYVVQLNLRSNALLRRT